MQLPVVDKSESQPWYSQGLRFSCTQCGNCCTGPPGFVWISEVEIQRLADFLKMDAKQVLKQYCRKVAGRISLKEFENPANGLFDCVFLKEQKSEDGKSVRRTCSIYSVRPLQCRTWPFWSGLLQSPQHWDAANERCPGIKHGRSYSVEKIEKIRDAQDWDDLPRKSKE
jgi:hypothetical protein